MSSTSTLSLLQDLMKETTPQYSPVSPTWYPHESLTQESTDEQPFPRNTPAVRQLRAETVSTSEEEVKTAMKVNG